MRARARTRIAGLHPHAPPRYPARMLACSSCRRFVRDGSSSCPFCATALVDARSPLGGFLGVILGVTLSACGTGDDGDDGASASASSTMDSTATGDDSTGFESAQPLYGPISSGFESSSTDAGSTTAPETTGPLYGPVTDSTESSSGSDSGTTGDSSGTDDGTSSSGAESVGPLYGPASG
jgi:hypothetical protein